MVRFSETALEILRDAVQRGRLANGRCLRLVPDGDQFALTIDYPSGWDTVIEHQGTSVLALSKEVKDALGGGIIEAKEDDGAFQLIVHKRAA